MSKKAFKKGDKAIAVKLYSHDGVTSFHLVDVTVESYGKIRGTATEVNGKYCGYHFYQDNGRWSFGPIGAREEFSVPALVRSVDEVRELARDRDFAIRLAQKSIDGNLRCCESNFPNLLPQYRAKAEQEIAALKAQKPRYEIRLNGTLIEEGYQLFAPKEVSVCPSCGSFPCRFPRTCKHSSAVRALSEEVA